MSDKPQASKQEKFNNFRREEVADQRQAAAIFRSKFSREKEAGATEEELKKLPGRGVCMCGWTQIAEQETGLWRVKTEAGYRSWISGIQGCGLRWVCPICTKKKAQENRLMVNAGLAASREREGLFPVMLTLTTRHTSKEEPKHVLLGIMAAEQRIKRLKVWERVPLVGYCRVLEWTYGRNGHHPHFHLIMLIAANSEAEAVVAVETLQTAYMRQLERAGRDGTSKAAWKRSFQVQGAAAAENYITKWGLAEEITGAQVKASVTPWHLLRQSRTAETQKEREQAAARWWEIIRATKDKTQFYVSDGWSQLVEQWLEAQEEPEQEPETKELVESFGVRERRKGPTPEWQQARSKQLAMREAAEAHDDLLVASLEVVKIINFGPTDDELLATVDEDSELIDDEDDFVVDQRQDPRTMLERIEAAWERRRHGAASVSETTSTTERRKRYDEN